MKQSATLEEITHIFLTQGQQQYGGEGVSQLEHALQCAYLAEQAQADKNMIASCLLHDLGHVNYFQPLRAELKASSFFGMCLLPQAIFGLAFPPLAEVRVPQPHTCLLFFLLFFLRLSAISSSCQNYSIKSG
jgi:hypothetical protein